MKKWLIYGLVLVLLTLAASEIYFRVVFREELRDRHYPLIYLPDSLYGYRYMSGITERIDAPNLHKEFKLNNHGYTGADFNLQKGKGTYRIMVVGASNAGGIWMEGYRNYSVILQDIFSSHGQPVEIINCAIDGRGRDKRHLDIIENELLAYQPDLILMELNFPLNYIPINREVYKGYMIEYQLNSGKGRQESINGVDRARKHWFLGFLYDISYTTRAFVRGPLHDGSGDEDLYAYVHKFVRHDFFYSYSAAASIRLLKKTQDDVARHGGLLQLFTYDSVAGGTDSMLQANNLQPLYLGMNLDSNYVTPLNFHFNWKGHQRIADSLYRRLSELPDIAAKIDSLKNSR